MERTRRLRRVSDASNGSNNVVITPVPQALNSRAGLRPRFRYCTEINGLPDEYRCDGCVRFQNSRHSHKPRDQFTSKELQCFKAWTHKTVKKNKYVHWKRVTDFIETNLHIAAESLQEDSDDDNNDDNNNEDGDSVAAVAPTPLPNKQQINFEDNVFYVEGERFCISVPSTHKIEHRSDISRWQRGYDILMNMRAKLQQKQYMTNSIFSQTLWAIMLAATPALPLSAAQYLFPLVMLAFFKDTGLFDSNDLFDTDMKTKKFVTSFPSDWVLRQHIWRQATRDTIMLGNNLADKKTYLACDKETKKALGIS